jgi:putative transposase
MPAYRRYYVPGATYFFTVVTHERRPILIDPMARRCLRNAFTVVRERWPFTVVAIVLLPNHLHAVWSLPVGDSDYSLRWRRIKNEFTSSYLASGGVETSQTKSRVRRGERGVWQRRFWEHMCRDEADLARCVDYIHWNPKKHGLVRSINQWPWSTFHRYVREGEYGADWGGSDPAPEFVMPDVD